MTKTEKRRWLVINLPIIFILAPVALMLFMWDSLKRLARWRARLEKEK